MLLASAAVAQKVTVDGKPAAPVSGYGESHARIEAPAPDFTADVRTSSDVSVSVLVGWFDAVDRVAKIVDFMLKAVIIWVEFMFWRE